MLLAGVAASIPVRSGTSTGGHDRTIASVHAQLTAAYELRTLILEDLRRFPDSFGKDIHRRVGSEIPERTFRRALEMLVAGQQVVGTGETRWRRYRLNPTLGRTAADGR